MKTLAMWELGFHDYYCLLRLDGIQSDRSSSALHGVLMTPLAAAVLKILWNVDKFHGATSQKLGMKVSEREYFSVSGGLFLLDYADVNIDSSVCNPIIFHDYTLGVLAIVDTWLDR